MHTLDITILLSAAVSCACFFLLQIVIFRRVHPEDVFNAIMTIFYAASVVHIGVAFFIFGMINPQYDAHDHSSVIFTGAVSYFVFALAAFVYILCAFGPSETSIRIRVVRELAASRGRLTHDQLLKQYNGRMILERRLQRFSKSGEIRSQQGKYILCKNTNAFFMIDIVAQLIRKILKKTA